MKKVLLAGFFAALVAFVWSMVSWMMMPWHEAQINHFTNNRQVADVMLANAPKDGIYAFPCIMKYPKTGIEKPYTFTVIARNGMNPNGFPASMVQSFLLQFLSFGLVAWLLSRIPNLSFKNTVLYTLLMHMSGNLFCLMDSVWMYFPWSYTGLILFDQAIASVLGGLVLACILGDDTPASDVRPA